MLSAAYSNLVKILSAAHLIGDLIILLSQSKTTPHLHLNRAYLFEALNKVDFTTLTERPLWDDWTVARLLPHIAAWDAFEANRIMRVSGGESAEKHTTNVEKLNAQFHTQFAHVPLHIGVAMLQKERNGLLNVLQSLPPNPPSSDTLMSWINNSIKHDADHAQEINAWRVQQSIQQTQGCHAILTAYLRAAVHAVVATVSLIPQADRSTRPICGEWTLKELVAHLAGWEKFALQGLLDRKSPPVLPDDDYNALLIEQRKAHSFQQVFSEYITTRRALITAVQHLTQADMGQPVENPWGNQNTVFKWLSIWPDHDLSHLGSGGLGVRG